jgi:hypothetical protein
LNVKRGIAVQNIHCLVQIFLIRIDTEQNVPTIDGVLVVRPFAFVVASEYSLEPTGNSSLMAARSLIFRALGAISRADVDVLFTEPVRSRSSAAAWASEMLRKTATTVACVLVGIIASPYLSDSSVSGRHRRGFDTEKALSLI